MSMSSYADVPMLICVDLLRTEYPLYFNNKFFASGNDILYQILPCVRRRRCLLFQHFKTPALGNLKTLDIPLSKLFWTFPKPE